LFNPKIKGIIRAAMGANIRISRGIAGRITITFPYDPAYVAKIKAVDLFCRFEGK